MAFVILLWHELNLSPYKLVAKEIFPMHLYHSEPDTRSHGWLSVSTEVINNYVHYSIYRTSFFVICRSIDLYEFCTRLGRCRAYSLYVAILSSSMAIFQLFSTQCGISSANLPFITLRRSYLQEIEVYLSLHYIDYI